jgi:hypothetical protein
MPREDERLACRCRRAELVWFDDVPLNLEERDVMVEALCLTIIKLTAFVLPAARMVPCRCRTDASLTDNVVRRRIRVQLVG